MTLESRVKTLKTTVADLKANPPQSTTLKVKDRKLELLQRRFEKEQDVSSVIILELN